MVQACRQVTVCTDLEEHEDLLGKKISNAAYLQIQKPAGNEEPNEVPEIHDLGSSEWFQ